MIMISGRCCVSLSGPLKCRLASSAGPGPLAGPDALSMRPRRSAEDGLIPGDARQAQRQVYPYSIIARVGYSSVAGRCEVAAPARSLRYEILIYRKSDSEYIIYTPG